MKLRFVTVAALSGGLAVACGQSPGSPGAGLMAPVAPTPGASTASVASAPTAGGGQGREDVLVNILDACDPETFGAQGIDCTRSGGVTFQQFIGELSRLGFVGPWHFAPSTANVRVGQTFDALNKGGEVHTFTEVKQFGGGIVPALNQLSGVPVMAPECGALEGDDFVAPGATYHEAVDHAGALKFQCCIHPWMRLEANAR